MSELGKTPERRELYPAEVAQIVFFGVNIMNKPAAFGSLPVITLAAFIAGGYQGESFAFCSDKCQKKFQDPAKYVGEKLTSATTRSRRQND